jgi:uncharacterized protein
MKFLVLLLVLVVAIGWLMLRTRRRPAPRPAATAKPPAAAGVAPMLACARCGLHLPKPEVLFDVRGQPYCCAEHRDAGAR